MTLAMITWGLAWTNAKIVNQYLNHYNLTFVRFFLGFLSLLPFTVKKIQNIRISSKILLNILVTSILFFLYNIFLRRRKYNSNSFICLMWTIATFWFRN